MGVRRFPRERAAFTAVDDDEGVESRRGDSGEVEGQPRNDRRKNGRARREERCVCARERGARGRAVGSKGSSEDQCIKQTVTLASAWRA